MQIDDELIRNTLRILKVRVRKNFYARCRRLGWPRVEILDWIEEMCGLGIAMCIEDWEPDKGSFLQWATHKTKYLARDEIRKENTQKNILDALNELPPPTYRDRFGQYLLQDQLRGLIGSLNPNHEEALALYHLCDLEVAEIARVMRCPAQTVYTWLRRGLEEARQHWTRLNPREPLPKKPPRRPRPREGAVKDDAEPEPDCRHSHRPPIPRQRKAI